MQGAEVKNTSHRSWVRVVGKRHDLQLWDMDARVPPLAQTRRYDKGQRLASGEHWIADALMDAPPAVTALTLHLPAEDCSDAPFVVLSGYVATALIVQLYVVQLFSRSLC
jgi:hypothetical protein